MTGLRELKVPIQVIWGREDRIVPVAHGEGLPASVKVTVLDHAGHLVHMEKAGRGQRARSANHAGSRAAWPPYIWSRVRQPWRATAARLGGFHGRLQERLGTLLEFRSAPSASQRIGRRQAPERWPWLDSGSGLAAVRLGGGQWRRLGYRLCWGPARQRQGAASDTKHRFRPAIPWLSVASVPSPARCSAASAARRPKVRSAGRRWPCSGRSPCRRCRRA